MLTRQAIREQRLRARTNATTSQPTRRVPAAAGEMWTTETGPPRATLQPSMEFAADGSERRVANGIGLFANSESSRVWALVDVAPGG